MVGKRIRELREEKEIEREQMVELVGICSTTMSLYESGCRSPKVETVSKLADLFEVSVDYLLGRTDCRYPLNREMMEMKAKFSRHPDLWEIVKDYNQMPKAKKERLVAYLSSKMKGFSEE